MTKRTLWLTVALVLGIIASSYAQVVEIVAPATVPEHSLVRVVTTEAGDGYKWEVFSRNGAVADVATFGRQMVFAGPPGRYVILQSWETASGEKRQAFAFTDIVAGKEGPIPPDPFVPPLPPDPPVVEAGPRWIIIVEETQDRTPQQAAVLTDSSFRQWLTTSGHDYRMIDQNVQDQSGTVPTACAPYLNLAKGKTLPRLFIVDGSSGDSKGKVLFAGDLPPTVAALKALIKQEGG
jgi:hypothetical protein